jgi:hypothetical protein
MAQRKLSFVIRTFLARIFPKRFPKLLFWSALHALWLIVLTILDLQLPHTTDEEMRILQFTSFYKRLVWKSEEKPDPNRFFFVCSSWDKILTDKADTSGFIIGKQVTTDRPKLGQFLQILNQKPDNHKFLVMDIRFEDTTSHDSLLSAEFRRTKNYLVSYHKYEREGKRDTLVFPVLPAKGGLSDYETTQEGTIVKFSAIQLDTVKTTPLLMYEHIHKKKYKKGFLVDFVDGQMVLNTFILDHRIILRPDSIAYNSTYHHAYLGELLTLPPELIHELTKDRIVIIGDFEDQDIHETIYGDLPGSIILLNAFLAFENSDNSFPLLFIIFLMAGYGFISYRCFSPGNIFEGILLKWLPVGEAVKKGISEFLGYVVMLGIMSVISYMIFNIHLTILYLAIYMQGVEWVLNFFKKNQAARKRKKALKENIPSQISQENTALQASGKDEALKNNDMLTP